MKHQFSEDDRKAKLEQSALTERDKLPVSNTIDEVQFSSLNERIRTILNIINRKERPASNMLFFVMYDITSNKVRTLMAKYLLGVGCTRVQRSIYLADLPLDLYDKIKSDLSQVQAAYDNYDSILIVPISDGYLSAMKIIGQDIDVDLITHKLNTVFI